MRTTRDFLAKLHRWQSVQWPFVAAWRALRHRYDNYLGAGLRARGRPLGRGPMCHGNCALASGCGHPSIDRHPAQPPSRPAKAKDHFDITQDLHSAFDNREIRPYFQPQVSLSDGQITGMEALARWHHPSHGMVAPLTFLTSVAEAQLWHKLTDTILHDALSAMRDLEEAGIFVPHVGVNFAQADLEHPHLVNRILWALDQFDLQPNRLSIEVLENVVVQDAASPVRHSVNSLAKLGCHVDLDDFGTAQNPFESLRQLDINRMKIDRSFIFDIDQDPKKQDMLAAVVLLAQRLNLDTIAEGIETDAELRVVQKLGCGHGQGYGIGRPMPLEQLQNWALQYQQSPHPHTSPAKLA